MGARNLVLLCLAPLFACAASEQPSRSDPAPEVALATGERGAWRALVVERREASAPGREMDRVGSLAGRWRVSVEVPEGAEGARAIAAGRAQLEARFGGRFLDWEVQLDVAGEAVRSTGLLGFDRELGQYELHWVSELQSSQRIARGHGDPERGGIRLEASVPDPESGALRHHRSVLTLREPDRFDLEQWGLDPTTSEWVLERRTTYRREPAGP